jgi:hypothetical protein
LSDDVQIFDEIISSIETDKLIVNTGQKRSKIGNEKDFYIITSNGDINVSDGNINQEIINNKTDISKYWINLDANSKEKFTLFDLNIIMFLLTKKNNKYFKKEKKKIIMDIDMTVRNKQTSCSYDNITV